MNPDDNLPHQPGQHGIQVPQRDNVSLNTQRAIRPATTPQQQEALADLTRSQIDQIYTQDPNHTETVPVDVPPATAPVDDQTQKPLHPTATITRSFTPEKDAAMTNPYQQTHDDSHLESTPDAWKEYHSAWQNYYQQYFHRYYAGHIMQTQAQLAETQQKVTALENTPKELTPEQALDELKTDLRGKITNRAKKVRKSRHFVPIAAALGVMLVFTFLQYNSIIFGYAAAYVSPGAINPSDIIVDPGTSDVVTAEPRLIIPKIVVDVPAIFDGTMGTNNTDTYNKQMAAMAKGVAWFGINGADSHPGQKGNTVLSGHSSNDWLDNGSYKFIFARLEQLKKGDAIYVNYKSVRYTYSVTSTKVVSPTSLDALKLGNNKPMLTLITCTPLGTSLNRLLVFAEQVSPAPSTATTAPAAGSGSSSSSIPGSSPTSLEKLFGG